MFGTRTFLLFAIVGCAIVNAEPRLRRSVSHPSTQEVETPSVDDSVAARSVEDPKSVEVSSEAEQDGYLKRLLTPNFKKAFGASAVAGLAFAANHVLNRDSQTVEPNVPVKPEEDPVDPEVDAFTVKTMNLLKNADGWNTFQDKQASILQNLAKTNYENLKLEQEQKENLPAVVISQDKLRDQDVIRLDQHAQEFKIFEDAKAKGQVEVFTVTPVAEFEERQKEKPEKRIPNYASCVDPWCNHDKEPSEEEEIEVIDLDRSLLPPRQDASVIDYTALDPEILRKHNAKVLARVKEEIVYVLAIGLIVGLGAVTN